jgi:hypothetical protein
MSGIIGADNRESKGKLKASGDLRLSVLPFLSFEKRGQEAL